MRVALFFALLGTVWAQDSESNMACVERLEMPQYPPPAHAMVVEGSVTATATLGATGVVETKTVGHPLGRCRYQTRGGVCLSEKLRRQIRHSGLRFRNRYDREKQCTYEGFLQLPKSIPDYRAGASTKFRSQSRRSVIVTGSCTWKLTRVSTGISAALPRVSNTSPAPTAPPAPAPIAAPFPPPAMAPITAPMAAPAPILAASVPAESGTILHVRFGANANVLAVGSGQAHDGHGQVRGSADASGLRRFHYPALHAGAAFGDDESIDHQRLRKRGEKAIAGLIAGGRKRFADANLKRGSGRQRDDIRDAGWGFRHSRRQRYILYRDILHRNWWRSRFGRGSWNRWLRRGLGCGRRRGRGLSRRRRIAARNHHLPRAGSRWRHGRWFLANRRWGHELARVRRELAAQRPPLAAEQPPAASGPEPRRAAAVPVWQLPAASPQNTRFRKPARPPWQTPTPVSIACSRPVLRAYTLNAIRVIYVSRAEPLK